jgi:TolB protein
MQHQIIPLLGALALTTVLLMTPALADGNPAPAGATPAPAATAAPAPPGPAVIAPVLLYPGEERHLRNVRQLTFGHSEKYADAGYPANFAEAYWAPDERHLILQATFDQWQCDQLFELDLLTGGLRMINDGLGRVTCGYYTADGGHCIYSCTAENGGPECPARPDYAKLGYVWPVYPAYDVYLAEANTGKVLRNLTNHPGYDAEATIDWHTNWMYFTSLREGDLDVYRMQLDSGEVQRLTDSYGYDGGPFISYDGKTVVYRHAIFKSDADRKDYADLLEQNLIRPGDLEIMAMDCDGSNKRQLTSYGASSFAPFLHPDNKTVIFCSNLSEPGSRFFELYTVPLSGGEPERVTYYDGFDGFPMFSPDGKYLVWCSNRDDRHPGETNVFIAEWIP